MRLFLVLSVATLALGACGPSNPCSSDAACEPAGYCDAEFGACMAKAVCDPACAAFTECSRGTCKPRYSGITVLKPTAVIGPNTPAEVRLELVAGRTRNDPPTLQWEVAVDGTTETVTGAPLQLVGDGIYRGNLQVTRTGTMRLKVQYPEAGLSSAEVTLMGDQEAPVIDVVVTAPKGGTDTATLMVLDPVTRYGANAYRRDETLTATIKSDAMDLDPSTVQAELVGIGFAGLAGREDSLTVAASSDCGARYCATVTVDLAAAEMRAFRGEMKLVVAGADPAGNVGIKQNALKVTRWKWAYDAGGKVKATPAIGANGTLYFGSDAATNNVVALRPSGTEAWTKSYGVVEGSPSVGASVAGKERIYVAASTGSGATLYALDNLSGDVLPLGAVGAKCGAYTGGTVLGGAAISDTFVTTTIESMHAVYNLGSAGGGKLVTLRPGGSAGVDCLTEPTVENVPYGGGVVVTGNDVYFSDQAGNVRGYAFKTGGGWALKPNFPVPIGGPSYGLSVLTNTSKVLGGGGFGSSGFVFTVPFSGGTEPDWTLPGTVPAWTPIIAGSNANPLGIVGMNNNQLKRFNVGTTTESMVATDGIVRGAPALGQDGSVYATSGTGMLEVRALSDLSLAWKATQFGAVPTDTLGDASSSVALDCARPDAGGAPIPGRPGTLYAGSATTNKLYAFVVDSKGLDANAPWPKFQHDERNSGNPATPITVCP